MSLPHAVDDMCRQLRLLWRHVRFGRASFLPRASPAKTAELETLFRVVNAHLRATGVEYTLAFGTLLGWHRGGCLLPHDKDIDFAAPVTDYPRVVAAADQLPRGFALHDTSYRHLGPKLYVSHGGWEADIYFLTERDGQLQSTERCRNPGDVAPFPRAYYFPRQPATLLGEPTFVPAQPVALLTHHYGYLGADGVRDPITRYFRPRRSDE